MADGAPHKKQHDEMKLNDGQFDSIEEELRSRSFGAFRMKDDVFTNGIKPTNKRETDTKSKLI